MADASDSKSDPTGEGSSPSTPTSFMGVPVFVSDFVPPGEVWLLNKNSDNPHILSGIGGMDRLRRFFNLGPVA
jgi:hypothetical protein